jgi:hypothetical protein
MNFSGLIIGAGVFLIIGLFHPLVIKCEYYFTKNIWWAFLILGLVACTTAVFVQNEIVSSLLAVTGFSLFWSIKELHEQEERVRKNWFPANPKNKYHAEMMVVSADVSIDE